MKRLLQQNKAMQAADSTTDTAHFTQTGRTASESRMKNNRVFLLCAVALAMVLFANTFKAQAQGIAGTWDFIRSVTESTADASFNLNYNNLNVTQLYIDVVNANNKSTTRVATQTGTGIKSWSGTVTGLRSGTTYYMRASVRYEYIVGGQTVWSAFTKESDIFTTSGTDKMPPTVSNETITLGAVTTNSIQISWQKATDNVTAQNELRYRMMIMKSTDVGLTTVDWLTDASSYTFTGLVPNTTYIACVVVYDEANNDTYYDYKTGIMTPAIADTTPPDVLNKTITISNITKSGFKAEWKKATDLGGSAQNKLRYEIRVEAFRVEYGKATLTDKDTYTFTGLDLTPGTEYGVLLEVYDEAGNKTTYTVALFTVPLSEDKVPPTIPDKKITISEITNNSFKASWNAANDDYTGVSRLRYRVVLTKSGSATAIVDETKVDINMDFNNYHFTDLEAGTSYNVNITVSDRADNPASYNTATVTTTSPSVAVASVTLSKSSTSIVAGNSETLTATVNPSDATDKSLNWTSSNTAVATVSGGVVTAISAGMATITATSVSNPDKKATCAVAVTAAPPVTIPVTSVTFNKSEITIVEGNTETLTAIVNPSDATDKSLNWTSSNTAVATVSDGVVAAIAEGSATITVTSVSDPSKTATCAVTVTTDGVGIEQVGNNPFAAYPNPTDGKLTIAGLTPGSILRLYSAMGTQVATFTANDEKIETNISNLSAGIYFLNVDGRTLKVVRK